jgi:hypothetical protein
MDMYVRNLRGVTRRIANGKSIFPRKDMLYTLQTIKMIAGFDYVRLLYELADIERQIVIEGEDDVNNGVV